MAPYYDKRRYSQGKAQVMKYLLGIAAAGLFALSTIAAASADCSPGHKSVKITKPVTTAQGTVITPKPGS